MMLFVFARHLNNGTVSGRQHILACLWLRRGRWRWYGGWGEASGVERSGGKSVSDFVYADVAASTRMEKNPTFTSHHLWLIVSELWFHAVHLLALLCCGGPSFRWYKWDKDVFMAPVDILSLINTHFGDFKCRADGTWQDFFSWHPCEDMGGGSSGLHGPDLL